MSSILVALRNAVELLGTKYNFDIEEAMSQLDITAFEVKKTPGRPKKVAVDNGGGGEPETPEQEADRKAREDAKKAAKNAAAKAKREAAKASVAAGTEVVKAPAKKKLVPGASTAASAAASTTDESAVILKPKRVLSDEQKEKMRLGRERKKAEKDAAAVTSVALSSST